MSFGTGIEYRMAGQTLKVKTTTTMESSKVNTKYNNRSWVRNISAAIALMLAAVTLLQARTANSAEIELDMSQMEAEIIAEIDQLLLEEELSLEESIILEVEEELTNDIVSIFNADNVLIASGNPKNDIELRNLLNKADYLSEIGSQQYYRLSE